MLHQRHPMVSEFRGIVSLAIESIRVPVVVKASTTNSSYSSSSPGKLLALSTVPMTVSIYMITCSVF